MAMTTNGNHKRILKIGAASLLMSLSFQSCGSDVELTQGKDEAKDCRFELQIGMDGFDSGSTRAEAYDWRDGDRVYFSLVNSEEEEVSGTAIYDAEDQEWTFTYDGMFPAGEYTGKSVFIKGVLSQSKEGISLTPEMAVYEDVNVVCEKTSQVIKVMTSLKPKTGRIRFQGDEDISFTLSGVVHNERLNLKDLRFETSEVPVESIVGSDGYSPYVYCTFPEASRRISIAYDSRLYSTSFKDRILNPGVSGYIELPTEGRHDGWTMTVLSVAELGDVSISSIGTDKATLSSTIVSNGNGDISDCGFCYSLSSDPTVNDVRISCGKPTGKTFSKTVTGLADNTTYHVRAYAINETGISYTEDMTFTTMEITLPAMSATSVSIEDGSDSATFKAELTSEGNGKVTECGFVYSTSPMPDIADSKVSSEISGTLTATVSGLKIGTKYYVRAYAKNEKGLAYGDQISFIGGGGKPSDDDLTRPNM